MQLKCRLDILTQFVTNGLGVRLQRFDVAGHDPDDEN